MRKRGIGAFGFAIRVTSFGWVEVQWDEDTAPKLRPRYCTEKELEAVASDTPTKAGGVWVQPYPDADLLHFVPGLLPKPSIAPTPRIWVKF